jgi:hypothetical protein
MAQITAVHGVQSTIQYLQRFEREVFKEIRKELIDSAKPIVVAVQGEFPKQPWDSERGVNWTKYGRTQRGRKSPTSSGPSFPRYQYAKVKRGVKADTGSTRRRSDGTYTILRIKQTDAAGSIYDLAKNTQTANAASFITNLDKKKRGQPNSRVMFPTVIKAMPKVINDVMKILNKIESRYSAEIAADTQTRAAQSARAGKQVRNLLGQFGKGF